VRKGLRARRMNGDKKKKKQKGKEIVFRGGEGNREKGGRLVNFIFET